MNLKGVIHGCLSFIPKMLKQGGQCHIVNTASLSGLTSSTAGRGNAIYKMTKHAVVSLSESLWDQLADAGSSIKVSVLCPGFVATSAVDTALQGWAGGDIQQREMATSVKEKIDLGMDPTELAKVVFAALRADRLYILPHPDSRESVVWRFERILTAYDEQRS